MSRRRLSPDAEARRREKIALRTGKWGKWDRFETPGGIMSKTGWLGEITHVFRNDVFAVLVRPTLTSLGRGRHLAIRNTSNTEVTWSQKQRIKNELAGEHSQAVEIFPPQSELIDEAPMYHLWVIPEGAELPFTIHDGRRKEIEKSGPDIADVSRRMLAR